MINKIRQIIYKISQEIMRLIRVTILLLCLTFALAVSNFKKITVEDPDALCLDGTVGAYYAHEGTHPTKILLSFEGGGWCGSANGLNQTIEDCLGRSRTDLGSSAKYPATWAQYDGILSDNSQNDLKDFSVFYLKYCTGTGHQGYRKSPINYKGSSLYFRGHNVAKAQLESINKYYGLWTNATQIVITGQSAGGLATFLWTNYIVSKAPKGAKVWSLPDSGIFLDSTNYNTKTNAYKLQFQNFMKLSNEQILPPTTQCNAAYKGQEYKCMFAQYNHPFIKVPLFAIQSPYDSWSIPNILGLGCESGGSLAKCNEAQLKYIEDYHANTSAVLKAIEKKQGNGYWAPSCSNHVYSTWNALYEAAFRIPSGSQFSLMHCISAWKTGTSKDNGHMDNGNWPINKPCSGVKQIRSD